MNYKEKIKELLKEGCSANEISEHLKKNKFETCSISSVNNYIAKLKIEYNAKTRFELSVLLMR